MSKMINGFMIANLYASAMAAGGGAGARGRAGERQSARTVPTQAATTIRQASSSTSTLVPTARITARTEAHASPCVPSRSRSHR